MPPSMFFGLCLVGEVSERVENRYLPSVFRHQNARRLNNVRVPADDEIRAAVGQDLRPGFLIVVWPERVLFTPVGKDDDKIRASFARARSASTASNVTKRSTIQAFPGAPPLRP